MLKDEYHEKVDKVYPDDKLRKIPWRLLDPATLKDAEEKKLGDGQSTYDELKNSAEERQPKEKAKKEFHKPRGRDDMDVSAMQTAEKEQRWSEQQWADLPISVNEAAMYDCPECPEVH